MRYSDEIHVLREPLATVANGSITPHRGCLVVPRWSELATWLRKYCQFHLTGVVMHSGIVIAAPSPKLHPAIGEGKLITLKCKGVVSREGYRVVRLESETLCYLGDPAWTVEYSDVKCSSSLIKSMLKLD